ncbi:amino acid adenylation domain-containing protein [Stenotrophomonas sp. LGBM10]|uniref:non-ribosomal peptide synthetase family protein n=1 Tax=Stenotrophomonas sp. LGBM10 TaxID=3390038 RepID=UPI00398B0289
MQDEHTGYSLSEQQRTRLAGRPADDVGRICIHAWELHGGLNADRLQAAVAAVVDRHEVLRTSYPVVQGFSESLQVVLPQARLEWLPSSGRQADDLALLAGLSSLPVGSLQAVAFTHAQGGHLLLRGTDLQFDAASLAVFARHLQNELAGGNDALEDAIVQHADYAEWQQQQWPARAGGPDGARLQRALPFARPVAGAAGGRGRLEVSVPPALSTQLLALAQPGGARASLLFAWLQVLRRHQGDSLVHLDIEAPSRVAELDDAIGPYSQRVVVGFEVDPAHALGQALEQLDASIDAAAASVAFAAAASGGLAGFLHRAYVPAPEDAVRLVASHPADTEGGLDLVCEQFGDRVQVMIQYDRGQYGDADAAALGEQYLDALRAVCAADLEAAVDAPAAGSAGTAAGAIVHGPALPAIAADRRGLAGLFLQAAAQSPERIALIRESQQLTYGDLERRSAQLAAHLAALGAGPERRIGVCLANPLDMIVAILAVLRCGATYLPLDVAYPPARLRYMLSDAAAEWLIVDDHQTQANLCDGLPLTSLVFRDALATAAGHPGVDPDLHRDIAAYMIYTSGSTGQPKGVCVPHAAILASTAARGLAYRDPPECFLLLSSFSFDSSIAGIFWTLGSGGTLVMTTPEVVHDIARLSELVRARGITHTLMVPSLYATLLSSGDPATLTSLRTVIVAGEACPPALVERHGALLPATGLFNEYGPTETAVWCTVEDLRAGGPRVSIGGPTAGTRIYVLDAGGDAVPVGVVGEVHIGGAGVARGYAGRADATAERYLPDPFGAGPGARLYRSGDLARPLADGRLEYVGRIDAQVKIRGHRIELGEVEAQLAQHPAVAQCAVVARGQAGEQVLIAYWSAHAGAAADVLGLHDHMRHRLPSHMLPQDYLQLDALPRTANGKIDRGALPAPEQLRASVVHVAPEPGIESRLASLWQELLGVDGIGRTDNFFKRGGHSLLAMQLISRIRDAFDVEARIKLIFDHPELSAMATQLQALIEETADAGSALDVLEL